MVKFKKRDVECVVDPDQWWKIELLSTFSYVCQDFQLSNFLVIQLLASP